MAKLAKELLPALDHLELALKAAEGHEDVVKGFAMVGEELQAALARVGIQAFSPQRRGLRSQRARGDALAARGGRRGGHRGRGLPVRLPHQRGRVAACARVWWRRSDGPRYRPLQDPRGRQEGLPGGHQEGVPQAGPAVPPGHQQGRRGRGALQEDLRGLRHPRRPREAQALRPRRLRVHGRQPVRRRCRRRRRVHGRLRLVLGHPVRDLQHRRRARAHEAGRRARPRPRDDRHAVLRAGDRGRAGAGLGRDPLAVHHVPRLRRAAGHLAHGLPGLQRPRRRGPGPGRVLDHPPVLALQRLRDRDRGPMPDVRGRGPAARGQALPGQHPRRRARGLAHQARGQGRSRPARRPVRRSVRDHPRHRVARLQAQGRPLRGRGPDHRGRGARRCRGRGPDAARHEEAARPAGHQARHRAAPARRRAAGAVRFRPERPALSVRDRTPPRR